jgi:hypothetical protein
LKEVNIIEKYRCEKKERRGYYMASKVVKRTEEKRAKERYGRKEERKGERVPWLFDS